MLNVQLSSVSRRGFLGGAAGLAGAALVTGCAGKNGGGGGGGAPTQGPVSTEVLPSYIPKDYVKPDFPAPANGYTTIPEFVKAFETPPGSGGTYKAMTPLWGAIPPTTGNHYFDAVNKALGSTIEFQISDGNTYGDKLAAVLASPKDVADWVSIPSWNVPPRFGTAVDQIFADLTPHLAGDKVKDYPNLANIPTDAWRFCVWNGKLMGLPMPDSGVPNPLFYRDDIFAAQGITDLPTTPDELIALATQLTDPAKGVYGADDLWTQAVNMYAVPAKWKLDGDKLVHRVESEEYRKALEWIRKLFESGAVHPDGVAGNNGDAKTRFESGRTLMMTDGLGGWAEALQRNLASNPTYSQAPMPVFGEKGTDVVVWKGNAASILSYIKKTDDEAKIKEMLKLADFLASPFGTQEFQLIQYGVEGEHYTLDTNGLPAATELAQTEVQPTYIFLVDPPVSNAKVQYPGYVEKWSTWVNDTAAKFADPVFYGMNITEPNQFASLGTPFTDLEKDIARGRKTLADLDAAVETWRKSGGEELRAFYQKILDEQ
ncbi:MAG: extracellular solute-binding protein [Arachnia sp.]